MTQLPPTLSHELEGYDSWDPTATATTADLEPDDEPEQCGVTFTSGKREGETCGEDRPCRWHDT